jgi:tetratricopeptide (TPR) repeat protein
MCYAELGHTFGVGDPDTGIYYLKQALILYLKLADVAKEAHALFAIGTLASRLPPPPPLDPPTPTRDLGGSSPKAPQLSAGLNRSVSTSSMGSSSSRTRRSLHPSQTAYNYISQARRLFARLGLAKGQAECAYQLGKLSTRHGPRGELEAAVVLFEEACDKFREAGGAEVDEAWSMYRLALVMLKVRSSTLAIDYLGEARRLFRDAATDERKAEGSCLLRIGEIYAAAGEVEKAKLSIEEVRSSLLRCPARRADAGPCFLAQQGMRLIGNDTSKSRIARRGTICLRRLSATPLVAATKPNGLVSPARVGSVVLSSPTSSPPSPSSEPTSPARSSNTGSTGTNGVGSPLAPVLEEAEEEEDLVEELETPGRRASAGGDAAWWSVMMTTEAAGSEAGTASPA